MNLLLDTCVISELVAKQPNPHIVDWIDSVDEDRLFLSVLTLGEIEKGIERLTDSRRKGALMEWLEGALLVRFQDRIVPVDIPVALAWGQLTADLEKQGRRMPAIDSLIAATCLHRDLHLVTRDENDFAYSGVTLINPWEQ